MTLGGHPRDQHRESRKRIAPGIPYGLGRRRRGRVEIYGDGRYIAITGRAFEAAPPVLTDISEVIASLV